MANNNFEYFQNLIEIICNSNIEINKRNEAENNLKNLIENILNWNEIILLLQLQNENYLFFAGLIFIFILFCFLFVLLF